MALCLAPFVGMFKSAERMANCCELWNPNSSVKYDEFWNSDFNKSLRVAMRDNDIDAIPNQCKVCVKSPSSHTKFYVDSYRPFFKENAEIVLSEMREDGHIDRPRISQLELGLSNKCSLACRMCTSNVSTKKWDLMNKLDLCTDSNRVKTVDTDEYIKVIRDNIETLREVTLLGGDPTMADDMYRIIQELVPIADKIRLNYLSNGEFTKFSNGKDVFDALYPFDHVTVVFSLDSIPEVNDYIRMGGKTSRQLTNIKIAHNKLNKEDHNINVHCALSCYSAVYFREYLDFITEELSFINWFTVNIVNVPTYYNPSNLPDEIKSDVFKKILAFEPSRVDVAKMKSSALKSITSKKCDYAGFSKALWIDMKSDDVSRGYDMIKTFPMFAPYVDAASELSFVKEDIWQ